MADTYQGWANYETWVVHLWLVNEEGSYRYWTDRARRQTSAYLLAQELKAEHEEAAPEVSGVFSDLLTSALQAVDWDEIASALIESEADDA
jgi:hypothetical protein